VEHEGYKLAPRPLARSRGQELFILLITTIVQNKVPTLIIQDPSLV
jgi:hypothetical protein